MDLSKLSFKGDRLYLRNPVDQTAWQPHFFALTQDRLHFTELQNEEPESEDQHSGRRMLNDVRARKDLQWLMGYRMFSI